MRNSGCNQYSVVESDIWNGKAAYFFFFLWGPKTRIGSEPGRRAKTAVKFKIQKHIAVNSQLCKENYIYYPKTGSVANKKI